MKTIIYWQYNIYIEITTRVKKKKFEPIDEITRAASGPTRLVQRRLTLKKKKKKLSLLHTLPRRTVPKRRKKKTLLSPVLQIITDYELIKLIARVRGDYVIKTRLDIQSAQRVQSVPI